LGASGKLLEDDYTFIVLTETKFRSWCELECVREKRKRERECVYTHTHKTQVNIIKTPSTYANTHPVHTLYLCQHPPPKNQLF
jgi:hypothetical protein